MYQITKLACIPYMVIFQTMFMGKHFSVTRQTQTKQQPPPPPRNTKAAQQLLKNTQADETQRRSGGIFDHTRTGRVWVLTLRMASPATTAVAGGRRPRGKQPLRESDRARVLCRSIKSPAPIANQPTLPTRSSLRSGIDLRVRISGRHQGRAGRRHPRDGHRGGASQLPAEHQGSAPAHAKHPG